MKGSQITNTSPQITWHHRHATAKASFKPKKKNWTSQWSVILRTFYRQILSLLYGSFFFWNFRHRLARELLVIFIDICTLYQVWPPQKKLLDNFLNSRSLHCWHLNHNRFHPQIQPCKRIWCVRIGRHNHLSSRWLSKHQYFFHEMRSWARVDS